MGAVCLTFDKVEQQPLKLDKEMKHEQSCIPGILAIYFQGIFLMG